MSFNRAVTHAPGDDGSLGPVAMDRLLETTIVLEINSDHLAGQDQDQCRPASQRQATEWPNTADPVAVGHSSDHQPRDLSVIRLNTEKCCFCHSHLPA